MILPSETDNEHFVFGLLFLLANKLQTIGDSFFEEITTKQWFITIILSMLSDREPTLNELSEAAGSSRQNVKQLVLKLEKKGLVELNKDEKDARKFRIKLTPQIEEFYQSNALRSQEFMDRLFREINPRELEATKNVLIKLMENLEEMGSVYEG